MTISQKASATFPELGPRCGSWIVIGPKNRVYEVYEREDAERCYYAGWKVEPAGQYLGRVNREIRNAAI